MTTKNETILRFPVLDKNLSFPQQVQSWMRKISSFGVVYCIMNSFVVKCHTVYLCTALNGGAKMRDHYSMLVRQWNYDFSWKIGIPQPITSKLWHKYPSKMAPTLKFQSYTRYNVSFLKKKYIGNNHEFETVCFSNGFNSRVTTSIFPNLFFLYFHREKFCKIPTPSWPRGGPVLYISIIAVQSASRSSSSILAVSKTSSVGRKGFIETVPPCSERR